VEIPIGLTTLLGHDDHPGEIPGLGPVVASIARDVVDRQRRAELRWVVVDTEGRRLSDGITRIRPTTPARGVQACGGVVELHVPEQVLGQEVDNLWARLLADVARQHTDYRPP
jgi:hypothetical protein